MRTLGEPDSRQLHTIMARLAMRAAERQEVIENPKLRTSKPFRTEKSVTRQRVPRLVRELW
jgi:hypothetical protein